ncbi:hypothetical protein ACP70R_027072 [Stipagrostis hirtigluma subsp. patula]
MVIAVATLMDFGWFWQRRLRISDSVLCISNHCQRLSSARESSTPFIPIDLSSYTIMCFK